MQDGGRAFGNLLSQLYRTATRAELLVALCNHFVSHSLILTYENSLKTSVSNNSDSDFVKIILITWSSSFVFIYFFMDFFFFFGSPAVCFHICVLWFQCKLLLFIWDLILSHRLLCCMGTKTNEEWGMAFSWYVHGSFVEEQVSILSERVEQEAVPRTSWRQPFWFRVCSFWKRVKVK